MRFQDALVRLVARGHLDKESGRGLSFVNYKKKIF